MSKRLKLSDLTTKALEKAPRRGSLVWVRGEGWLTERALAELWKLVKAQEEARKKAKDARESAEPPFTIWQFDPFSGWDEFGSKRFKDLDKAIEVANKQAKLPYPGPDKPEFMVMDRNMRSAYHTKG